MSGLKGLLNEQLILCAARLKEVTYELSDALQCHIHLAVEAPRLIGSEDPDEVIIGKAMLDRKEIDSPEIYHEILEGKEFSFDNMESLSRLDGQLDIIKIIAETYDYKDLADRALALQYKAD